MTPDKQTALDALKQGLLKDKYNQPDDMDTVTVSRWFWKFAQNIESEVIKAISILEAGQADTAPCYRVSKKFPFDLPGNSGSPTPSPTVPVTRDVILGRLNSAMHEIRSYPMHLYNEELAEMIYALQLPTPKPSIDEAVNVIRSLLSNAPDVNVAHPFAKQAHLAHKYLETIKEKS